MSPIAFFSVVTGICFAVASAAVTLQLLRGSWLFLVMGKQAHSDDPKQMQKAVTIGKRMSFVTGALALLLITIVLYEIACVSANAAFIQITLVANNIAFVLFIVALVAFYVMQRSGNKLPPTKELARSKEISSESARMVRRAQKAKIDVFPTATLVLLIAITVVAFGMGFLFSLV